VLAPPLVADGLQGKINMAGKKNQATPHKEREALPSMPRRSHVEAQSATVFLVIRVLCRGTSRANSRECVVRAVERRSRQAGRGSTRDQCAEHLHEERGLRPRTRVPGKKKKGHQGQSRLIAKETRPKPRQGANPDHEPGGFQRRSIRCFPRLRYDRDQPWKPNTQDDHCANCAPQSPRALAVARAGKASADRTVAISIARQLARFALHDSHHGRVTAQ